MSDEQAIGADGDAMTRLETALTTWDTQLRDMHEHIAAQLSRAHERLDRLLDTEANGSAGLLQQRDAELELLRTRLTEAERAIADTQNRAETAQNENERRAAESETVRASLEAAQTELTALREENARGAAERDSVAAERDAARAERDAAFAERDMALSGREEALAECARVSDEFEAARAKWDAQPNVPSEELEEALQNVEEHARRHGAAAMERDRLLDELEALRARHTHVCGQKQEADAECVVLRRRLRELEEAAQPSQPSPQPEETEQESGDVQMASRYGVAVKKKLGEILVDAGVITPEQLDEVLGKQSKTERRRLGAILVEHGYTNEDAVARAFAAQIQMPFTNLSDDEVDPSAAAMLPAKIARMHHCVPLREEEGLLSVAMANPLDLVAIEDIELATKCLVFPLVATTAAIDFMVTRYCR